MFQVLVQTIERKSREAGRPVFLFQPEQGDARSPDSHWWPRHAEPSASCFHRTWCWGRHRRLKQSKTFRGEETQTNMTNIRCKRTLRWFSESSSLTKEIQHSVHFVVFRSNEQTPGAGAELLGPVQTSVSWSHYAHQHSTAYDFNAREMFS